MIFFRFEQYILYIFVTCISLSSVSVFAGSPSGDLRNTIDSALIRLAQHRAYEVANSYDKYEDNLVSLVERLEYEPRQAFIFMRDQVNFDPYLGELRGWRGALAAKAGNALDRSLLLFELLNHMGADTRIVYGELSKDNAKLLYKRSLINNQVKVPFEPLGSLTGLGKKIIPQFQKRADRDYKWLKEVLNPVGIEPTIDKKYSTEHVWVQAKFDDKWLDLDPAFLQAKIGDLFGVVKKTVNKTSENEKHFINLAVKIETIEDGIPKEQILLEHSLESSKAERDQVFLGFNPRRESIKTTALKSLLNQGLRFQPFLMINGDINSGKFTPMIKAGDEKSKPAQDFFKQNAKEAIFSAIYLDINIESPDGSIKKGRHVIFDRISEADRRNNNIKRSNISPMVVGIKMPSAFESIHQIIINNGGTGTREVAISIADSLGFIASSFKTPDSLKGLDIADSLWPLGIFNMAWLSTGERLVLESINQNNNVRFYVGEPNVSIITSHPIPSKDGQEYIKIIDFLHDTISVVASDDIKQQELFYGYLKYGTLRSSLETTSGVVLTELNPDVVSISASSELKRPLLVLSKDDIKDLHINTSFSLIEDLQSGAHVIVNKKQADSYPTWWKINPKNGITKARISPGYGGNWSRYKNYVNSAKAGAPYFVDLETMNSIKMQEGISQKKYDRAFNNRNKMRSKGGGSEYVMLLSIAIETSLSVGTVTGLLAVESFAMATLIVAAYKSESK